MSGEYPISIADNFPEAQTSNIFKDGKTKALLNMPSSSQTDVNLSNVRDYAEAVPGPAIRQGTYKKALSTNNSRNNSMRHSFNVLN